jgi:hypothetical protein
VSSRSGNVALVALAGLLLALAPRPASAQYLGPSPYLAFDNTLPGAGAAISPFSGITFSNYFHLETFEDNLLNTPGVTASAGAPIAPSSITDSVDADDGTIDGLGTLGRSFFSNSGATGISFTFNSGTLGGLPTHAGIVWTDGASTITFQAFDAANALIGTGLTGSHADGSFGGTTAEDRFYGIIAPGGISRIFISNASGGIEVDHLQYGRGAVASSAAPEPATLGLLLMAPLLWQRVRRPGYRPAA